MDLGGLGRAIVLVALVLLVVGGLFMLFGRLAGPGRFLPGDIVIRRPGFTFVFPIVTSILLSLVLTLVFLVVSYFMRR
jgi:uncharacterized membrane protein